MNEREAASYFRSATATVDGAGTQASPGMPALRPTRKSWIIVGIVRLVMVYDYILLLSSSGDRSRLRARKVLRLSPEASARVGVDRKSRRCGIVDVVFRMRQHPVD